MEETRRSSKLHLQSQSRKDRGERKDQDGKRISRTCSHSTSEKERSKENIILRKEAPQGPPSRPNMTASGAQGITKEEDKAGDGDRRGRNSTRPAQADIRMDNYCGLIQL